VPAARPTAASIVKPSTPAKSTVPAAIKPKSNGIDESTSPSLDFIRWTKQSLTGLTVNVDEFIQMLLTFPIDPPASDRAGVLEIISDSVYASSSTLDGRRFAQEFFTRRKADAARPKATTTGVAKSSLADVVKSVPKKAEEAGFRIVKAKGKKKN
jgi:PERQ amino acid-rich with GYF domain-containing protein